jgi:3-keto-disaccharide hydrolase
MKTAALVISILFVALTTFAEDLVPASHIDLFNGHDFTGWKFVMRSNSEPSKTWAVRNGVIHITGQPYGYAQTERTYRDNKLTVEWRFAKIAPKADNSGIFLHINPPDKV